MIFVKINVIIRKEWIYLPTISMFYGIVIRMYEGKYYESNFSKAIR